MNLKRIGLKNFKCFKDVEFDFSRITIFTGANSSGKSSAIYGLLGALQSREFPFSFNVNGGYVNMGDFRDLIHNHKIENSFSVDSVLSNGKTEDLKVLTKWIRDKRNGMPKLNSAKLTSNCLDFTVERHQDKYLVNIEYFVEKDSLKDEKIPDAIKTILQGLVPNVASDKKIPEWRAGSFKQSFMVSDLEKLDQKILSQTWNLLFQLNYNTLSSSLKSLNTQANYIGAFRVSPERTYYYSTTKEPKLGVNGNGYIQQMVDWKERKPEKYRLLIESLKKIGVLEGYSIHKLSGGRFDFLVKANSRLSCQLYDVGFGVSQFLPIIVADFQLGNNSNLVISQPEIHLHPRVQAQFGDYIAEQVSKTKKNYIIETHSEYFLNRIRLLIAQGKLNPDNVKTYYLRNGAEGAEKHMIGFEKNGQITNAPKDFFETYMMDVMNIAMAA